MRLWHGVGWRVSSLSRWFLALLACVALCLSTPCARAADAGAATAEADVLPPRELPDCGLEDATALSLVVVLVAVPEPLELRRAVCEWFRIEPWRVRFVLAARAPEPPPSAPEHGLLMSITLPSPEEARLALDAGATAEPRHSLRRVALEGGLDEAGREMLAQVLHSSAQAFQDGALQTVWSAEPEAAEPAPPPPSPRPALRSEQPGSPEPSQLVLRTGLGVHAYARGPEPATFGPSLLVALEWQAQRLAFGPFLRGALWTSIPTHARGFELGLRGATAALGISASLPLWAALRARAAFDGAVEWPHLSLAASDAESARTFAVAAPARPSLGAELGLELEVGPIAFSVLALARWQLSSSQYDVLVDGTRERLLRPWRLQPGALLEAVYAW